MNMSFSNAASSRTGEERAANVEQFGIVVESRNYREIYEWENVRCVYDDTVKVCELFECDYFWVRKGR